MGSVPVELFSRKFTVRTDNSDEHLLRAVDHIKAKLKEIDPDGNMPEMQLAILTLLNLGDELIRERDALLRLREAVDKRSTILLEKLRETGYSANP